MADYFAPVCAAIAAVLVEHDTLLGKGRFVHKTTKEALTAEDVLPLITHPATEQKKATADITVALPRLPQVAALADGPGRINAKDHVQEIVATYPVGEDGYTEKVEVVNGAMLSFTLNKMAIMQDILQDVLDQGDDFGFRGHSEQTTPEESCLTVDFSSPNIAKPFHAGHLRSTIIGNFVCNLHRRLGWRVEGINYLGDWGKQYGLLAVGYTRYGDEEKLVADPIHHLFDIYVAINKDGKDDPAVHEEARVYFRRMEEGDETALALWKRFRDLSISKYRSIYERLNVKFDHYHGESLVGAERMEEALAILMAKGVAVRPESDPEDSKALLLELGPKIEKALVRKSDGATLYITRDLAAARIRKEEFKFTKSLYVVASQQDVHFRQVFKSLELMGYDWASECSHINFGLVKGMSTRSGDVVFLEDILDEAKARMLVIMEASKEKGLFKDDIVDTDRTADLIGLSAIIVQDMTSRRGKGYTFDWDRMLRADGDTGPYLQYAHARVQSIHRRVGDTVEQATVIDSTLLPEPEALKLALKLGEWPLVIGQAFSILEPCTVIKYLMVLVHAMMSVNDTMRVMGTEPAIASQRLALLEAGRTVLAAGLRLVGIVPLDRM